MNKPILSFCIPTYNRAQKIFNCVKHILKYPGDKIEVVVSNNASTDNTLMLLNTIDDRRLKIFTNEENIGISNWPLVVSKASGKFATLMSDEDIVCLENIPHFLELLERPNNQEIGVIIYNFLRTHFFPESYISTNCCESVSLAMKYGGHITGHIINTRYFILRELVEYKRNTNSDDPLIEPQLQILMDIAKHHRVMLTAATLVDYGTDIPETNMSNVVTSNWNGWGVDYRKIQFRATANLIKEISNIQNEHHQLPLLFSSIRYFLYMVARFLRNILSYYGNEYRPNLWKKARETLKYDSKNAIEVLVGSFSYAANYLTDITKSEKWATLIPFFDDSFTGFRRNAVPKNLTIAERLLFGDLVLFITCVFNAVHSVPFPISVPFPEDYDDVLGLTETAKLQIYLGENQLDKIINSNCKIFRVNYFKGQAYFRLKNWNMSKECFEKFLDTVMNPKYLSDIVTGVLSVQYSMYYLGIIYRKLGNINKSDEYFARCQQLTENLLLGESLYIMRLRNDG